MKRLLNKEHDELGMMQVDCNRPIMLLLAVSKGNRSIKPRVVLSRGESSVALFVLCLLLDSSNNLNFFLLHYMYLHRLRNKMQGVDSQGWTSCFRTLNEATHSNVSELHRDEY